MACRSPRFVTHLWPCPYLLSEVALMANSTARELSNERNYPTPILLHHPILTRFFVVIELGWRLKQSWMWPKKVWVLDTYQLTVLARSLGFLIYICIYIWLYMQYIHSHILYIHLKVRVTQRKRCVRRGGTLEPKIIGFSGLQKRSDVPKSWECQGASVFCWISFGQNRCCL